MRTDATRDFDEFVQQSSASLLRTAYLIVWDRHEAEDVVQNCLYKIARRWPKVRGMEQRLAYARRVLVNVALDDARDRSRRKAELAPAVSELSRATAPDAFGDADLTRELIAALAELPPRQRAVLALRYFEDLSEAQTADALGCSLGTVKSTASRALDRLRVVLESSVHSTNTNGVFQP